MKQALSNALIFCFALACFVGASFLREEATEELPLRNDPTDTLFADEIERSLREETDSPVQAHIYALPTNTSAQSLVSRSRIAARDVKAHAKHSKASKADKGYYFLDSEKNPFAATKLGTDFKHHFLNNFLVGYRPFQVSEIWMPHQVLSMRLKYQLDEHHFPGYQEIWLSSYQAFKAGRGDCEDHSIALADWLIDMGEDARVVVGTHDGGGHAWVVVIRDSGTFLLESTSKRRQRRWSSYPLAKLAKGYVPESMFNRDYFWTNADTSKPGDYTGSHWTKTGKVIR